MSPDSHSVSASYTSPSGTHTFSIPIAAPCTDASTAERTKYLGELRANTKKLQADVNKFLTEKMEEDKLQQAQAGSKDKKEEEAAREEENYGEEVVEEGG